MKDVEGAKQQLLGLKVPLLMRDADWKKGKPTKTCPQYAPIHNPRLLGLSAEPAHKPSGNDCGHQRQPQRKKQPPAAASKGQEGGDRLPKR